MVPTHERGICKGRRKRGRKEIGVNKKGRRKIILLADGIGRWNESKWLSQGKNWLCSSVCLKRSWCIQAEELVIWLSVEFVLFSMLLLHVPLMVIVGRMFFVSHPPSNILLGIINIWNSVFVVYIIVIAIIVLLIN